MGWNCGGTDISIANVRNSQTDTHDGIPRLSSGRPIGIVARTPGKQFQKQTAHAVVCGVRMATTCALAS